MFPEANRTDPCNKVGCSGNADAFWIDVATSVRILHGGTARSSVNAACRAYRKAPTPRTIPS